MSHASHLRRERILLYIFKELKREIILFCYFQDIVIDNNKSDMNAKKEKKDKNTSDRK